MNLRSGGEDHGEDEDFEEDDDEDLSENEQLNQLMEEEEVEMATILKRYPSSRQPESLGAECK